MGFDTHNTILNLGSVFYFVLANLLLMVISLIATVSKCTNRPCQYLRDKIPLQGLFNSLFIIFFEGYMEMGISCYLNFQNAIVITNSDWFSYCVAYIIGAICCTVVPCLIIFIMRKEPEELGQKQTLLMYSNVYDGLKTSSVLALNYNLLYIIRRVLFITIMFNPWLQTD